MSLPLPVVCEPSPDCCGVPSSPFYGQGETFLNAQTGFLLECPPGFSCDAGFYPTPLIVPAGTIPFTPPTGQNPLTFRCCDGSYAVRYLPDGFTLEQFAAAAQSIVDEAAAKLAQCMADQYNSQHATKRRSCAITTAATLPTGFVDDPYSATLLQTGATGTVTWSLVSGTLPPGLSLSSSGVISGTPTSDGAFLFVVRASGSLSCTKQFSLAVEAFCNDDTDWCGDPGTCRLRVKDFNAGDWVAGTFTPDLGNPCDVTFLAGWDGSFSNTGIVGVNPCLSYSLGANPSGNPAFTVDFDSFTGQWSMNYTTPAGTMFFALGPIDVSPRGIYTRDDAFSCTGPATVEIEGYIP